MSQRVDVFVTLKNGVLDPQGKAIESSLQHLGFAGVKGVRQGKFIEVELEAASAKQAEEAVSAMCEQLLANTVIENYRVVARA
jgi:phosphoribosylformylglycinamidine synthase subunit PurS